MALIHSTWEIDAGGSVNSRPARAPKGGGGHGSYSLCILEIVLLSNELLHEETILLRTTENLPPIKYYSQTKFEKKYCYFLYSMLQAF